MPVRELSGNEEDHIQVKRTEKKLLQVVVVFIVIFSTNQDSIVFSRFVDYFFLSLEIFRKISRNVCLTFEQYSENLQK